MKLIFDKVFDILTFIHFIIEPLQKRLTEVRTVEKIKYKLFDVHGW